MEYFNSFLVMIPLTFGVYFPDFLKKYQIGHVDTLV
jgi:hypothetical protein